MRIMRRFAFCFLFLLLAAQACLAGESVLPGDVVTFGRYEQDDDSSNGAEPVEWQVLEVRDGKALLLSRRGLDAMPYHAESAAATWETCSLRAWLNGEFLAAAFTEEELAAVVPAWVDNSRQQGFSDWKTDGGNSTEDRVFLLSVAEADRYFGGLYAYRRDGSADRVETRVAATMYARMRHAFASDRYKTQDGEDAATWWLRSPGEKPLQAAYVDCVGALYSDDADISRIAVRPALWVDPALLP